MHPLGLASCDLCPRCATPALPGGHHGQVHFSKDGGGDQLSTIKDEMEQVKGVMVENIGSCSPLRFPHLRHLRALTNDERAVSGGSGGGGGGARAGTARATILCPRAVVPRARLLGQRSSSCV